MKSMEVVPPPSSIAGIRIAFEITGSKRACSFKLEEADARARNNQREMLASKAGAVLNLQEEELNQVLDLADAILNGDLQELKLKTQRFMNEPARLALYRDRAQEVLATLENCNIELLPSKPFRTAVAGVQTDVISLIIKEKSTEVMLFVASHPYVNTEVYSIKKGPNGISELVSRPCDAAQLLKSMTKRSHKEQTQSQINSNA